VHGKGHRPILCGADTDTQDQEVAVDASVAQDRDEDELFGGVRAHVEAMICWSVSQEALGLDNLALEEAVLAGGFELMRLLTEAQMQVRALREERRSDVVDADGHTRVTIETGQEHTRVFTFGPVKTVRMAYRRHRRPNLYPADRDLNWAVAHSYSAGVAKRIARAAAVAPFAQAAEQVSAACAITIGKRQAEQLAIAAAADFDAFYAARRPAPCGEEVGLLITADGSAFSVRPEALRPATAKAAAARAAASARAGWPDNPGELRKSTKRSAELVAVADIPPAPRTRDDIITALFAATGPNSRGGGGGEGPRAQGKTVFASARRPIADVIAEAFAEAERRDGAHARPWFAVVDGNNAQITAIHASAAHYGVKVPILIDVIHVVQYLWKAAGSFFDPGDPDARAWVKDKAAKILDGKARDVWIGIRRHATTCGYSPAERRGADECATYLENKAAYLDYPAFLAAGWPIASGLIEGAARWLIKDRMEVTGARWGLEGAEAVLRLRALVGNGDFNDYFAFHLKQEKRRNHDSRYQPQAA
jgi:hypothetical protein